MTEAVAIAQRTCAINPILQVSSVRDVVSVLWRAYQLSNDPGSFQEPQYELVGEFFTLDFSSNRQAKFYPQPFLREFQPDTPYYLSREAVIHLLESIAHYITELAQRGKFPQLTHITTSQNQTLQYLKNGLGPQHNNKEQLEEFIHSLLDILTLVDDKEDEREGAPKELKLTLFPELQQLLITESALDGSWIIQSWEYVKIISKDADATPITGLTSIRTTLKGTPVLFEVTLLRSFLGRWLKLLYSDTSKAIFLRKRIELPEAPHFFTQEEFFLNVDHDDWRSEDHQVAEFITKELSEKIKEFLKLPDSFTPTGISNASTDSAESDNEITKNKKEEELETLAEKFAAAGASYRAESERLTAILLPQFFASHGFIEDSQASFSETLDTLRQYDPASYALVYREFQVELENVLRSLSPDEFARLKSGDSVGFRMAVLRKLYSKLGTNPRFVGALGRYRDQFIEKLEIEAENTELVKEKERINNKLKKLNTKSNADDIQFDDWVEKIERKRTKDDDWSTGTKEGIADHHAPLTNFSQFSNLTQADLELLILSVTKEQLDFPKLFRNLDLVIAERWSPDQLRGMSVTGAAVILGISLDGFKGNPQKYNNFINILVQYLYVRRQRLADHYQRDALSRDRAQPDENATSEQIEKLLELQLLADQLTKKDGANNKNAGEIIAAARALDTQDIRKLRESGHQLATFIGAVHSIEKNDRKTKFEAEQEKKKNDFFAEGVTISKKRKMLEDLGIFKSELDTYQDDAEALNNLYQQSLTEESRSYLGSGDSYGEYDSLSYYEEQDDEGVVEDEGYTGVQQGTPGYRNPGRQRYGTPGKARSLAKGSISTLHRLQELKNKQKRAKEVKKRLQQLRQGAQTATRLLVANKELVATGVVAGAGLLRGYHILQNGGVFSKLFGGLGALGGGIGGGWAGTFLPIPLAGTGGGVVVGSALGGWGGMELGYVLDKQTGFALDKLFGTGAGQAPAAAAAYTPPVLPAASALHPTNAALIPTNASSAQTIGVTATQWTAIGTTVAYTTTTMLGAGAIYNSLQPPPLGTLGSNGTESKYVILQKVASNADGTAPNGTTPAEIKYQLWIEARDDYRIEVTNITDVFSVRTNSQERGDQPSPATPSCSDITFENLKSRINSDGSSSNPIAHKNGAPDPGEVVGEDGRIFVGECAVNFDGSYNHTGVLNTFTVNFTTTGSDGAPVEDTAETAELVCFGKCPQRRQGVWPTNGVMTQGPFGSFSHGTADAIDISNRAGPDIFAPYTGTAYFFTNDDINVNNNPATAGLDKNYGNHVILVTEDGFVLLFAHMDAATPFVDKINGQEVVLGEGYQITEPCTKLGKMGNTGWSEGIHLHYEYRVYAGRSWYSYGTGGRKILETLVPFPFENNKSVTTDCGS